MPDLSELVQFHSGHAEISNYFTVYISYFDYYRFKCCIANSVDPDQLMKKPADLDLHCLQES